VTDPNPRLAKCFAKFSGQEWEPLEYAPNPKNVPGDFYVEDGCCTLCGVPVGTAPDLFSQDDEQCWVSRQPASENDFAIMLKVLRTQELGCVRYRGNDSVLKQADHDAQTWYQPKKE
jgi:hypothetical protein